jgi:hypothetical protein
MKVSSPLALPSLAAVAGWALGLHLCAQSADWRQGPWHEPQVRYLLADLTLGGNVALYRQYGREGDPDSREAMRLWDAGSRVANTNDVERTWIPNKYGKDGRVMRVVFRGTRRTISGNEVLLTTDGQFDLGIVRAVLLDLSLGTPPAALQRKRAMDPDTAEALRRWEAGVRVLNTNRFTPRDERSGLYFHRATGKPASTVETLLNSDLPYSETNVRYFMADIALGGSLEFYRGAAQAAHEISCLEAVHRTEDGYRIINLEDFERKKVAGQTLIVRKGGKQRISGMEVRLSSD